MSAPEAPGARAPLPVAPQRYRTIVVCGGGCYGAYYVRQLARACAAGAIVADRVLVVDHDAQCRVAREAPYPELPALEVVVAPWADFFAAWLGEAARDPETAAGDAVVPSPLMPHLMYEWLLARARARWPGRAVETHPLPRAPFTPWERAAPDGTHYVSFAEWMCPINCVEPVLCPHIRGPRTWSMPDAVRDYAAALAREDAPGGAAPISGPVVFHCAHRAFGVGMFDVRDVLAADALVARAGTAGPARVLVGTTSHCHGALNLLVLGAPA